MNITYRQLKILLKIAETGSMHAAATALSITQPAITKQIQLLEHYVGDKLVRYDGKITRLTLTGQRLLPYINDVDNSFKRLIEQIDTQNQQNQQTFCTITTPASEDLIISIYQQLQQELATMQAAIYITHIDKALSSFYEHNADVIISTQTTQKLADANVHTELLGTTDFILVTCNQHPILTSKFSKALLQEYPMVTWQGPSFLRDMVTMQWGAINKIFELSNVLSAKKAVLANLGWAFLPDFLIHEELKAGKLVQVKHARSVLKANIFVTLSKTQKPRAITEKFLTLLKDHLTKTIW